MEINKIMCLKLNSEYMEQAKRKERDRIKYKIFSNESIDFFRYSNNNKDYKIKKKNLKVYTIIMMSWS